MKVQLSHHNTLTVCSVRVKPIARDVIIISLTLIAHTVVSWVIMVKEKLLDGRCVMFLYSALVDNKLSFVNYVHIVEL